MNPPYKEPKPAGFRRPAAHIDIKIWKILLDECNTMVAVMTSSCYLTKNAQYTGMTNPFKFETAGIDVRIYEHEKNKQYIHPVNKYILNGKYDWLKENRLKRSFRDILVWIDTDTVPKNHIAFCTSPYNNITLFEQETSLLRKNNKRRQCILFIDCKNEEKYKKTLQFMQEYVNPRFVAFSKRFEDHHVDRGFLNTIFIPKYFIED